ncbi:Large ribosomal subunit protein bL25 [Candidatus Liberibacter solanacearum]|uniref:50S ribosomal protein L25/general stress protein Ctc n=1 Tax=Candidatus Liberibacter solanacearum TaxID=556287 RepID=UPI0038725BD0
MIQEEYKLKTVTREKVGKGSSRLLRRNGKIPATIYGNISSPKSIALSTKDISKRLYSKNFMTTIFTIDLGKESIRVLPKDYQLDPVSDVLIHMDFLQISEKSTISVQVPIRFINQNKSPGLKMGGSLNIICHEIPLLCPADKIPDSISADLDGLKIGDNIHMTDIRLPEGITSVSHANCTIAKISSPISSS